MKRVENLNAPSLAGWVIAATAGVVTFLVAKVIGGFDYTPSVFFGVVVMLGAGMFTGMSWGGSVDVPAADAGHDVVAAPVAAAPVAAAAPDAAAATVASAAPVAKAAVAAPVAGGGGSKPAALAAPRGGSADDLKKIEGIGPALEKLCNEMGIYHFDQIAGWGANEIAWMDGNLKGFKGRVTRDKWVAQAKLIGSVGMEEFQRRAKTNDY